MVLYDYGRPGVVAKLLFPVLRGKWISELERTPGQPGLHKEILSLKTKMVMMMMENPQRESISKEAQLYTC